jgi:acyl carrier protein
MVPVWTPGELYIGGAGVARGYLQDAGLTAARFIVEPLTGEASGRMYRTGDRVRLLTSGDLEFLGRIDDQVKIRGFRVELGEVESSLRKHPAVSDAAMLAHDDGSGNRLASFVVYRSGKRPASGDLRTFLHAAGLPEYMIPHAVIELDVLPLTPNGKLDRKALSELLVRHAGDSASDDTPLTEWEAVVARIWRELLDVDQIGASDNFYDLGGHSLIAIQVVTALEKRAGVHISPRDLVFHTLRQFAVLCEAKSPLKVAQT